MGRIPSSAAGCLRGGVRGRWNGRHHSGDDRVVRQFVYMNNGEIISIMTPQEMKELSYEQISEWGLRGMELLRFADFCTDL